MVYLFLGEDEFSKDIKLEKIKQELKLAELEPFNFEVLYSRDLDLRTFKTRLLLLPVKAKQRLILLKDAPRLKTDIKQYLLTLLKKPLPHVSLILDARRIDSKDRFFEQISRRVKLINFRRSREINAFTLARQVMQVPVQPRAITNQRQARPAIRLLRRLILQGEKPERILGALRYQLHQEGMDLTEKKKRLSCLLNCDVDIKTGRLKPEFALERLLLRLCCF